MKGKSVDGKIFNLYSKDNKIKKASRQEISDDDKFGIDNVTIIADIVDDYIDLTQSTISSTATAGTAVAITSTNDKSERDDGKESMIGRLMKTTTKDPTKKNSGDQGAEYAEYYNDIDEFDEEMEKRPRARSIRQSYTMSSPYNRNPLYTRQKQLSSIRKLRKIRTDRNFNDNFYGYNDNFQEYQTEKYPKMDRENFDTNSLIRKSSGDQYTLPLDTDDKNVYNNYEFNLGTLRSGQEQNYPNNYGSLAQKNDEKYLRPQEDNPMNDQFQLHSEEFFTPQIDNNEDNAIESKNPTNIYEEPYEKTFVLPSEQQQLRYIPVYDNNDQGNHLYPANPFKTQTGLSNENNVDTSMDTNKDSMNEPLQKVIDISPRKHVQPVERFLNPVYFDSEENSDKKDESKDAATSNQQMARRGFQKGVKKSMSDKSNVYERAPIAKGNDRLEEEFVGSKNGVRNRNSVEEDVANVHHVNIAVTVNETKEVADQILNRIVDELEEIKMDHSTDKNNEGNIYAYT